ncbi:hypothetical protein [Helicobacter sp. 16-1353]|uniref:hypothetical protein n=1 Tax=Helicobacter sp. 16-1353 TaxID=2004996 RepID=UPI0011BEDE5C|nr:hypothetical protein [Helicobacter sp. 16-1353]
MNRLVFEKRGGGQEGFKDGSTANTNDRDPAKIIREIIQNSYDAYNDKFANKVIKGKCENSFINIGGGEHGYLVFVYCLDSISNLDSTSNQTTLAKLHKTHYSQFFSPPQIYKANFLESKTFPNLLKVA